MEAIWAKQTAEGWRVVLSKLQRIGLKRLWHHPAGHWAVSLQNRTYHHWMDITPDKLEIWKERLR